MESNEIRLSEEMRADTEVPRRSGVFERPAGFDPYTMLLRRAIREPRRALAYVIAIAKGFWCKFYFRLLGRRFQAGKRLRVFGRLSVRGPGSVIMGDDVAIWGRVTPWTHSREARIVIGDNVLMGGTTFGCEREITIGRDSILANARIMDTDHHSVRADRRRPGAPIRVSPVVIGQNVWVAASAALLPGTRIGDNSVVGCGAVCSREFPPDKVILGNPARVAMPIPSVDDEVHEPS